MGLPRIPQVDGLALTAEGLLPAPVRVHDLAVQDQVRRALSQRPLQLLLQPWRAGRQDLDHLIEVPVRGGLRQPEAGAQPPDIALVPEPRQREQRLLIAAQPAGSLPRADLAPVPGEQPGNEPDQLPGHVEHDTIGDHAEPLPGSGLFFGETSSTGGSAPPQRSPRLSACLPGRLLRHVCPTRPCWENVNVPKNIRHARASYSWKYEARP